jgi:D-amino-acid oxidase
MQAVVIGAGVIGLSCGIRLRQVGFDVEIWAREAPHRTTSSVAAAIWYPYNAFPRERVAAWGARTFSVLAALAADPAAGITMRQGLEIFPEPPGDPWWLEPGMPFRHARADELPEGYLGGYVLSLPVIEMPIYLAYLEARFRDLGGRVALRPLHSLDEALADAGLVVNCAGLGARELAGDPSLYAIRGQVVRVAQIGLERFWLDDYGPRGLTYIIPRSRDIVLGGTADIGDERTAPDPATAQAILERCIALEPGLRAAEVLEHKVGLRPGRPAVRLEADARGDRRVIHCYGHGGAGVTLSWGCAEEVAALAAGSEIAMRAD